MCKHFLVDVVGCAWCSQHRDAGHERGIWETDREASLSIRFAGVAIGGDWVGTASRFSVTDEWEDSVAWCMACTEPELYDDHTCITVSTLPAVGRPSYMHPQQFERHSFDGFYRGVPYGASPDLPMDVLEVVTS